MLKSRQPGPVLFRLNNHYRVNENGSIESELRRGRPSSDGKVVTGPWHSVKPFLRGKREKVLCFTARVNGENKAYPVSLAVLMSFGPPRPSEDAVVVYKDGNRENCHIENLCWIEPPDLPENKAKASLEEWTLLYQKVREGAISAEEICRKKKVSLAECISKLRKGKREYERQLNNAKMREWRHNKKQSIEDLSSSSGSESKPTSVESSAANEQAIAS